MSSGWNQHQSGSGKERERGENMEPSFIFRKTSVTGTTLEQHRFRNIACVLIRYLAVSFSVSV